jgi:ferredoxin
MEKKMSFKIIHDKDKCVGCGACVAVCPDNWEYKEDKVLPKKTKVEEVGCNQVAAETCPVSCIKIEEE